MSATMEQSVCRIYVASLSDYNAGILHGKWIDANQEPETINGEIQEMLRQSRCQIAEEWAIHDYEGFGTSLSEYEDIVTVSKLANAIEEHGEALKAYVSLMGDIDYAIEHFEEAFICEAESAADYMEEMMLECYELPRWLSSYYVDWKALSRDSILNGDISVHEVSYNQVYIFNNHI